MYMVDVKLACYDGAYGRTHNWSVDKGYLAGDIEEEGFSQVKDVVNNTKSQGIVAL